MHYTTELHFLIKRNLLPVAYSKLKLKHTFFVPNTFRLHGLSLPKKKANDVE